MPLTGPDLVGAGYPISRPLLALLGGTGNATQPNVPVASNLDFALGGLADLTPNQASCYYMAVPVSPGVVVSKLSLLIGATAGGSITAGWGALYTGTGSAPGTAGATPSLISTSTAASTVGVITGASAGTSPQASGRYDFTFATPQTITSVHCPFGYIYAAFTMTPASSTLSMTCASAAQYPWYATSPFSLAFTTASAVAPGTTIASAGTRTVTLPVVLLS